MFASTIVCFYLISSSWMSAVSVEPNGSQKVIIRAFLDRLHAGDSLADAVDNTQREALDAYCRWKIDDLTAHVNKYLSPTHMDPNIDYSSDRPHPPGADFTAAWKEIPYLVYLIRYSSLRLLNDLKQDLNRRGHHISPQSILAVINDEYVGDVSVNYGDASVNYGDVFGNFGDVSVNFRDMPLNSGDVTVNYGDVGVNYGDINYPQTNADSFETLIIYIAIQFSMNQEMLDRNQSPHALLERLRSYQDMIRDLHHGMARYMQIETRLRYHLIINGFRDPIEALYHNHDVRGFEHRDVKFYVDMISKAILSVMAIYAGGPMVPTGTGTISRVLQYEEVVRHFMRLDPRPNIQIAQISDRLLSVLSAELRRVKNIYPPEYPWMAKLLTMAIKLRGVGERPTGSRTLTENESINQSGLIGSDTTNW
jgi:hypothetical protein